MECRPIDNLIVRDGVVNSVQSKLLEITDCILDQQCKFWQDDDKSAEQIADCLIAHIDIEEWTEDEFEYAVRLVNFFCCLKLAYVKGLLKEDKNGHLRVPDKWKKDLSMSGFEGDIDDIRNCSKR